MKFKLIREPSNINGTSGVLFIDGFFLCFTLENTAKIIPAGVYNLEFYNSPKNKVNVLRLKDVPDRSEIEIHIANWSYQLEGCIAVGTNKSGSGNTTELTNSKIAFDNLMDKVILPATISISDTCGE